MKRIIAITLTSLWFGCGAAPPPASEEAAFPEAERTVRSTGSSGTIGLRVVFGGDDTEEQRTHLEAVVVNVDGEETVTDLGNFDGRPQATNARGEEVGRLHLHEGDTVHELVLREHEEHLVLQLNGETVRHIALPEGGTIEAREPFLLRPPSP